MGLQWRRGIWGVDLAVWSRAFMPAKNVGQLGFVVRVLPVVLYEMRSEFASSRTEQKIRKIYMYVYRTDLVVHSS